MSITIGDGLCRAWLVGVNSVKEVRTWPGRGPGGRVAVVVGISRFVPHALSSCALRGWVARSDLKTRGPGRDPFGVARTDDGLSSRPQKDGLAKVQKCKLVKTAKWADWSKW